MIGQGAREAQLRKLASTLPIEAIMKVDGIPREELIEFYNMADLYVHPSSYELESMAVLEAISCGLTPVISKTNKSAASQFAIDDRCLFHDDNVDELSAKIDYWIEHQKERQHFSKQYVQFAKNFSIENSIHKLETIYHNVRCSAKFLKTPEYQPTNP